MAEAVLDCLKIPPKTSNVRRFSAFAGVGDVDFCTESELSCGFGGAAVSVEEEEEPQPKEPKRTNNMITKDFLYNTTPLLLLHPL